MICIKSKVKDYLAEDENNFLKLKAQLRMHISSPADYYSVISLLVAVIALMLSIWSVYICTDVLQKDVEMASWYAIVGLCLIIFVCIWYLVERKKYVNRDKWMKYIEVVLEEMETQK